MDFSFETPDWKTPAGRLLDRLATALPEGFRHPITVFGSAPLQLFVDPEFLSQDCDLIGDAELEKICEGLSVASESGDLHFQVCDPLTFRTAQGWETRACHVTRHGHTFVFPHPWDILVSKISRLEPKDLEAFQLVVAKTGHPTSEELKEHLQLAVDLYRPQFDEETGRDLVTQTHFLWDALFGQPIDVRAEIIRPALERRKRQYDQDAGPAELKDRLRHLGQS